MSNGQEKRKYERIEKPYRAKFKNLTFVIIVIGFHKVLHCVCAIKIPIISQFPTPTGSDPKKSLTSIKSHWIA